MQLPSTLTEVLGQEFLSEYMRLKQGSDGKLSEYDKAELVNSMMSGLNNFENKTSDYLESDIKIAPTDDEKTIKEYGNNLALLIKKYFDPLPETEMTIFAKALQQSEEGTKKAIWQTLNRLPALIETPQKRLLRCRRHPVSQNRTLNSPIISITSLRK